MTQKIIKIGKSSGITIPKDTLKEMGVKAGDRVEVKYDQDRQVLTVKPEETIVGRDLVDWMDKFAEDYRPALEALAKK